jgi:hypothetical protein
VSASFKLKYFPNSPNVVVMEFSARMVMVAGPIPGIYPYNAVEAIMNNKFRMHSEIDYSTLYTPTSLRSPVIGA